MSRRDKILRQIEELQPVSQPAEHPARLARFLADVPKDGRPRRAEKRDRLAPALSEQAWSESRSEVAIKPRPELEPFFKLNFEDCIRRNVEKPTRTRVELPV